jgi:hypothetical protein
MTFGGVYPPTTKEGWCGEWKQVESVVVPGETRPS